MPTRQAEKWILPISIKQKELLKSIALCTNTPMCDLVDTAITEFIDRIKEGDFKQNIAEMKARRKEHLKIRKMLVELARIKSEYSQTMKDLGIEQLAELTPTKQP